MGSILRVSQSVASLMLLAFASVVLLAVASFSLSAQAGLQSNSQARIAGQEFSGQASEAMYLSVSIVEQGNLFAPPSITLADYSPSLLLPPHIFWVKSRIGRTPERQWLSFHEGWPQMPAFYRPNGDPLILFV